MPCGDVLGVAVERIAGVVVEVAAVAELNGAVVGELEGEEPFVALLAALALAFEAIEGRINAVRDEPEVGLEEVARAVVLEAAGFDTGLAVFFTDASSTIALNATDFGTDAAVGLGDAAVDDGALGAGVGAGTVAAIFNPASGFVAGVGVAGEDNLGEAALDAGEMPPGDFAPPCFPLNERRRLRTFSEVDFSKFNSPGAAPGSG